VTMMQVLLFFFASLGVAESGEWIECAAIAFPFSSPFAMLARAAIDEAVWIHAAALAWQIGWVAGSTRLGAALFRRRVMQSGPRRVRERKPRRALFSARSAGGA
jgi:ABC-2 type transport system permease protein